MPVKNIWKLFDNSQANIGKQDGKSCYQILKLKSVVIKPLWYWYNIIITN